MQLGQMYQGQGSTCILQYSGWHSPACDNLHTLQLVIVYLDVTQNIQSSTQKITFDAGNIIHYFSVYHKKEHTKKCYAQLYYAHTHLSTTDPGTCIQLLAAQSA